MKDPYQGELTLTGFFLLVVFSISAVFMIWAHDNENIFFIALTAFYDFEHCWIFFYFSQNASASQGVGDSFFGKRKLFSFLAAHGGHPIYARTLAAF